MASRRYGRYLSEDERGRPRLDAAKVKGAEKFDGKFVVISNDDTLSAEDIALGYKGGWIIESCFRRMKQTGLQVRPRFHWTPRRIEAHVMLCVLAPAGLRAQRREALADPARRRPRSLAAGLSR
jgi:transposase